VTFLEFVCGKVLGPPSGSTYICPYCQRRRLSVRPPRANLPIKWACHRCQRWGDEFDLFKDVLGLRDYSDRLDKREELHLAYLRDEPTGFSPRGGGDTQPAVDDSAKVELAFTDLCVDLISLKVSEKDALAVLKRVAWLCQQRGVSMESLLIHWSQIDDYQTDRLLRHAVACQDPRCNTDCLRMRGLVPLDDAPDWGALATGTPRNGKGD
jgi:hypothetical protein